MEDADIDAFVQWFRYNGGYVDTKVMGISEFPGSGRGAIALCDIPVCGLSIPDVPFSHTRAERVYHEQLIPAIKTSPTLLPPSYHGKWYTLCAYHRTGSRILSRSFTVTRWTDDPEIEQDKDHDSEAEGGESDTDEAEDSSPNTSIKSSIHIDHVHPHPSLLKGTNDGLDSGSEDDEEDDPSDVAMVPMTDILNARWGSENAKLFYGPFVLRTVTTKNIKQGEQILNTYGDPPNSDLLRRYGHVDLVRLHLSSVPMPRRHGDTEMNEGDTDVVAIIYLGKYKM